MTENPKPTQVAGRPGEGCFQSACMPLAFPYVPPQRENPTRFENQEALQTGTLFPDLDFPFRKAVEHQTKISNTALKELMAIDFAIDELGLYLITHSTDQAALQAYHGYLRLAQEGRARYEKLYGPLFQRDLGTETEYAWIKGPWPWEYGGER